MCESQPGRPLTLYALPWCAVGVGVAGIARRKWRLGLASTHGTYPDLLRHEAAADLAAVLANVSYCHRSIPPKVLRLLRLLRLFYITPCFPLTPPDIKTHTVTLYSRIMP